MDNQQQYRYLTKLASIAAVVAASLMLLAKLYAWWITDSASLLASVTDSLFDISASLMSFFVLRYALTPADAEHKFGHGKAEAIAALGQSAFILGSACLLVFHAIARIDQPVSITQPQLGVWVSLFSILITLALVALQRYVVSKTQSLAIKADSMHYKGDILLNASVLIALLLTQFGYLAADAWFAIAIALFLLWNGVTVGYQSLQALMDRELDPQQVDKIEQLALQHPQVKGLHQLRTRQAGITQFIQLHLELDGTLSLVEANQIAHQVESNIQTEFPQADIIIHQDPV